MQVGRDRSKDFCLAGAWRSLDEGDSLSTSMRNRFFLTGVILMHSCSVILDHKFIILVERTFLNTLPYGLLYITLGRWDHAIWRLATLPDCGDLAINALRIVADSEV